MKWYIMTMFVLIVGQTKPHQDRICSGLDLKNMNDVKMQLSLFLFSFQVRKCFAYKQDLNKCFAFYRAQGLNALSSSYHQKPIPARYTWISPPNSRIKKHFLALLFQGSVASASLLTLRKTNLELGTLDIGDDCLVEFAMQILRLMRIQLR